MDLKEQIPEVKGYKKSGASTKVIEKIQQLYYKIINNKIERLTEKDKMNYPLNITAGGMDFMTAEQADRLGERSKEKHAKTEKRILKLKNKIPDDLER